MSVRDYRVHEKLFGFYLIDVSRVFSDGNSTAFFLRIQESVELEMNLNHLLFGHVWWSVKREKNGRKKVDWDATRQVDDGRKR